MNFFFVRIFFQVLFVRKSKYFLLMYSRNTNYYTSITNLFININEIVILIHRMYIEHKISCSERKNCKYYKKLFQLFNANELKIQKIRTYKKTSFFIPFKFHLFNFLFTILKKISFNKFFHYNFIVVVGLMKHKKLKKKY